MVLLHSRKYQMTPEDEEFYIALGKRMSDARKAHGITQVELAKTLGISQQTVAHYEGGRLRLVASMVPIIAEIVGLTVLEFMGEPPNKPVKKKRGPKSKLEQQIEQIQKMPRSKQKFVEEMLDTVINKK